MSKQAISTEAAPGAIGPYSQAVEAGGFIFTSGQLGINPQTGEFGKGIEGQTRQSLRNVQAILESVGADMDQVIKTTVFLKDMNDFVAMNEVYSSFFAQPFPARSAVEVARLPKDALVEIEAVVLKK